MEDYEQANAEELKELEADVLAMEKMIREKESRQLEVRQEKQKI
jgi:hypothetical protein